MTAKTTEAGTAAPLAPVSSILLRPILVRPILMGPILTRIETG